MAAVIGEGVSLEGIYDTKYNHTFNLAAGVTKADEGKAVSQDVSADNKVKLALDGEIIIGRLLVVEDRMQSEGVMVATVNRQGYSRFNYTGAAPTRGQGVLGSATPGVVKASGAALAYGALRVWSVRAADTSVLVEHGM